jgi:AcrR family transcriptional regulator
VAEKSSISLAAQAVHDMPNPARLVLILAAEKMIAMHGLGGVSLRQINEAAGHKNSGATHYHFGSREGLIQAVLNYRIAAIAARRDAIVDLLKKRPAGFDIRDLISSLAHPLVEELKPRPEGNYFLRFSERIRRERNEFQVEYSFPVESWRFAQQELLGRLAYLPPSLAALRVQMVLDHIISGLAGIEARLGYGGWTPETFIAIETLIDFITAGITSPVAPEITASLSAPQAAIALKTLKTKSKKTTGKHKCKNS